jgi:hypothetical protein
MHSHQTAGLADAATFDDLLQYGANLLLGQGRAEQRRALAFGKSRLAGSATEHPTPMVRPMAAAHREVFASAFPIVGALGILAAKPRQIVHDRPSMT